MFTVIDKYIYQYHYVQLTLIISPCIHLYSSTPNDLSTPFLFSFSLFFSFLCLYHSVLLG